MSWHTSARFVPLYFLPKCACNVSAAAKVRKKGSVVCFSNAEGGCSKHAECTRGDNHVEDSGCLVCAETIVCFQMELIALVRKTRHNQHVWCGRVQHVRRGEIDSQMQWHGSRHNCSIDFGGTWDPSPLRLIWKSEGCLS